MTGTTRPTPAPGARTSGSVVLVGGGLAGCLVAYRLSQVRPEFDLTIVEAGELGGNHTWCFHETDLTPEQRDWMAPFVTRRWDGYEVRFPDRKRRLSVPYCCITAERLRTVMAATLKHPAIFGRAVSVDSHEVRLADGRELDGPLVLDGRGGAVAGGLGLAWQAFVGLQLRLAKAHRLAEPLMMDATVSQDGAYRFVYCLPFGDTELLVEDTRYQDAGDLDIPAMRANVLRYARVSGWQVESVLREEHGVLPIVLSGGAPRSETGPVPIGMRASLFHQVTGYSLPDAVRLADMIAAEPELTTERLRPVVNDAIADHWRRQGFYRLLNRMLFMAGAPDERWRILSRFYALGEPLIGRFYAGETTAADVLRILTGRPPVSVIGALGCLRPSSANGFVSPAAEA